MDGSEVRILHVLDHSIPVHSGYSFRTQAILEQQRAMGWETVQLTGGKHPINGSLTDDVDGLLFFRTPAGGSFIGRLPVLSQLDVVRRLERRLDELVGLKKPDILHAHSPALNGVAALAVGKRHDIPVVYECRAFWEDAAVDHGTSVEGGARYRLTRGLESRVFRRADAVTTICEGLKQEIVKRGIDPEKITTIPNAVDPRRFSVERVADPALGSKLGVRGKLVLGFIGSFYAYEGLTLLVRALPAVLERIPDIRVLLVGGGPQEQQLSALVERLGLSHAVLFTGRVPHAEVSAYYNMVDVFVYPRLSMRLTETVTPLKPLEAMAQGGIVLASDVGGHRELIREGRTGFLFRPGDAQALSEKILDVVHRREMWPAIGSASRRFIEEERNWAVSVSKYHSIYNSLMRRTERH